MKPTILKLAMFILVIPAILAQSNCVFLDNGASLPGGAEYYEIEKIPYSDKARRAEIFNNYPVEKQIDIFLFAMIYRAPARPAYRDYLAVDGESKIPMLVAAIEGTNSPNVKSNLMSAIWEIDRNCNCVANDPVILDRLRRAEPISKPSYDRGDWLATKNYKWILFELQRNSLGKKTDPEAQSMQNPYANTNTTNGHD